MIIAAYLHIIMGVLFVGLALSFLYSFLHSKNKKILVYFLVFLFFGLYSLSLGIPLMFSPINTVMAAWGFVVGMTFLFFGELAALYTVTFTTGEFIKRHMKFSFVLFSVLSVICLAILVFDLREPIIDSTGIVFWNANPIAGWGLGLLAFYAGSYWFFISYKNLQFVENKISKAKTIILGLDGMAWALAALLYFTATSFTYVAIAFILAIVSLIFSAPLFWIFRVVDKRGV